MKFTQEHKNNISKALKGKAKPWFKKDRVEIICNCGNKLFLLPGEIRKGHGKYCSRKCYYKYRILFNVSEVSHEMKGEKHWNWKGDKAKYAALHLRVQQRRGKAIICEDCGSRKFVEWANLSGQYEDIFDYKSLCKKCHVKLDNIAARVLEIKKERYNLSDLAYKGWETRRRGDATA